jgi:hypothetical protein
LQDKGEGEDRQRPRRLGNAWYDPKWDPENDKDEWTHNHFIHFILEGLMRAKTKSLNCFKIIAVEQGPLDTP